MPIAFKYCLLVSIVVIVCLHRYDKYFDVCHLIKAGKNMQAELAKGSASSKETHEPLSQTMMLFLALLVGIVSGFGAVLFRTMIALVHNAAFLGKFSWVYNTLIHTAASPWGWGIIFAPVIGAVIVAFLVKNFAPEAKGHGVPEVMYSIYYQKGIIRPIVAVVKSVASAVSIGTGGSIGREGPIIQIGAAFGSTLGSIIRMPMRQRFILIAAGAGGGIAATFNAPLGGLAFAMELVMVSISARTVLPVAVATVASTNIGRIFFGMQPSFPVQGLSAPAHVVATVTQLSMYVPFGILMGFLSLAFVRLIYLFEDLFDAMPGNYYTRHMLGMLIVGVMMYAFLVFSGHYYIQGVGYATIVNVLARTILNPWFLILLFLAKFLSTCLTLGSGASGGIFSPSLFLGAVAGYAFGVFLHVVFPGIHEPAVAFAIAGMSAMVGGCTGAVITSIVMVFEMTGDYKAVLPVMITVGLTYAIRKYFSDGNIYTLKILRRGDVLPEGLEAALVSSQKASQMMESTFDVKSVEEVGEPSIKDLVIVVENDKILGVQRSGIFDTRYKGVSKTTPMLRVLRLMRRHETRTILVFEDAKNPSIKTLCGVIAPKTLIANYAKNAELMA
jgi:chloride channel protein, CIC family